MKIKIRYIFVLLSLQLGFSQNIKGRVTFNKYAIPKVEVINASTKTLTLTDADGQFSITAKTNDILVFVSKQYQFKKLVLSPAVFTNGELIVEMMLKAEELKEVVITNMPAIKLSTDLNYENSKVSQYNIDRAAQAAKVTGVNMGTIENGITKTFRIFNRNAKETPETPFKDFVKLNCDQNYFENALHIKSEQIGLFIEFCDADPRSKHIVKTQNILTVMDFLFEKTNSFKKLEPNTN
ncbi:peptidase associated/transthyretin-like domain-containing protein [Flavobacterium muglaense]|uniref:CarboxypepD_reg-like domain-containing protein n=1 Tax=Flavobacterium muglaense TaxID=2764716 RepID=A0A923MYK7_9FLAO|nr:hypothetical protein [Flavobacterium muglaense]MBC5836910.1 hypothetical protein [Flavobacterium muglaense]MBC5843439.1 hypothetical protein [Flavobacterium muglaense]